MFGKRFAYEYAGHGEGQEKPSWPGHGWYHRHMHRGQRSFAPSQNRWRGGWTPPWLREGPRFFAMHRGRGPFGPGGHFDPRGPFGFKGEGSRFFGRGDVKYALLELLQERPMHGYEMMKALEERSGGFYTPSPGSIYPTLQMLEDGGLVTANEVEGKKVYSITDAGRASLAEWKQNQGEFAGPPWMRRHGGRDSRLEIQALGSEVAETARLLAIAGRLSLQDPEKLARLRSTIERTRNELNALIYGEGSAQQ